MSIENWGMCLQYISVAQASASQTFLCRGPVTTNAEAAQPFVIKFYFKQVEVNWGLRTMSSDHIHISHFTFLLNQKNSSKTKHKKTEQRNNEEHKEITLEDKKQEKPNTFLQSHVVMGYQIQQGRVLRDRGTANGAHRQTQYQIGRKG